MIKKVAIYIVLIVVILLVITNPNEEDYLEHNDIPKEMSLLVDVDRTNYFLFSTFKVNVFGIEGPTTLGIINQYIDLGE